MGIIPAWIFAGMIKRYYILCYRELYGYSELYIQYHKWKKLEEKIIYD